MARPSTPWPIRRLTRHDGLLLPPDLKTRFLEVYLGPGATGFE